MSKRLWRVVLPIVALALAGWIGYDMYQRTAQELLWGWRPLILLTFAWLAVVLLIHGFAKPNAARGRLLLWSSLSGIMLSVGFPPSPLTPLIFIGLVPLLMVEEHVRTTHGGPTRWTVFRYAFNTFFIWNICTTWWVLNTSFLPGIVANVLNTLFMATVFTLFHQARHVFPERVHALVLAAFWIAFELLHLYWEISWPWLTFGHALAQYPVFAQWYEYTGVFGGSLWFLLGNFWAYQWWISGRHNTAQRIPWKLIIWIVLPCIWSGWRYMTYPLQDGAVEVVVVQPNFEPHYEKFRINQQTQLARCIELSRSALTDTTAFIVFPETTFGPVRLNDLEDDFRIRALRQLLEDYPQLQLVTGLESYRILEGPSDLRSLRITQDRQGDTVYWDVQNSAIRIAHERPADVYFKSKFVPGAERFPYKDILPFLKPIVDMLQGSVAGLTEQETRAVFAAQSGTAAPVICYESVYGQYVGDYVRNGADMIFIVTNDGWWDNTPGHIQHLQFGALRAIEHRRPIARSANTGISCFINTRGDVLQPTQYGETIAIRGMVAPGEGYTFYTRWGDIIARLSVFLALLLLALTVTRSVVRVG